MPEMDGIEATNKIRILGYREPVVALTANTAAGQADMFLKNGFTEFISKPIDTNQLNMILNKLIRDKQTPEVINETRSQEELNNVNNTPPSSSAPNAMLIESFIRDARKAVTVLAELSDFENPQVLHKFIVFVHGMKSSLWNIGEESLSKSASVLEQGGRDKNLELLKSSAPLFLSELRSLLKKLEALETSQESVNSDGDYVVLNEQLQSVKEMCSEYNRKGALDILAGIGNYSGELSKCIKQVKEFVLHSDFEEAEEKTQECLSIIKKSLDNSMFTGKDVSGLDIKSGIERYNGNEEIYCKVLHSYTSSMENIKTELYAYGSINTENLHDYEIRVHGIKGASRDILAGDIANTAEKLESSAHAGDLDYINNHNKIFLESFNVFITELKNMLSEIDEENPKPNKNKPDSNQLSDLYEACLIYDIDTADSIMEEIEKYNYDAESDNELVAFLRENLDLMKFVQITEKLKSITLKE
jgi:CheY-like chemotaxis protein